MLFDTHCHLNIKDFHEPLKAIEDARKAGVTRIAVVGIDIESSQRAVDLSAEHEGVYAIVGIHPTSTGKYKEADLGRLRELLDRPKTVALGEIGLDYHWDHATKGEQFRALRDQLDLAADLDVPVVFHCREAYDDLLALLEDRPARPYLLHCFAGDRDHARRASQLDCYFGVDGPITYPKAVELREIVAGLPKNRVVLETDAPYLTPVPHRGKPNFPAYIPFICHALASVWRMDSDAVASQTTENANRFFRLEP